MTLASVRAQYPCLLNDFVSEGISFDTLPAVNMVIIHSVPITTLHSLVFQRVLGALLEKKNTVVLSVLKLETAGQKDLSTWTRLRPARWPTSQGMSQKR